MDAVDLVDELLDRLEKAHKALGTVGAQLSAADNRVASLAAQVERLQEAEMAHQLASGQRVL